MMISPRSAMKIGDSLELSPQSVVENDHFVNPKYRRGTSNLPGELSLQFARLGVGDDTSRYGYRHRRIFSCWRVCRRCRGSGRWCGVEFEFGRVGHDPAEAVLLVGAIVRVGVFVVATAIIVALVGVVIFVAFRFCFGFVSAVASGAFALGRVHGYGVW